MKKVLLVLLVLVLIGGGSVGAFFAGRLTVAQDKCEVSSDSEVNIQSSMDFGEYIYISKREFDLEPRDFLERLLHFRDYGVGSQSREEFFGGKDFMIEFAAGHYADGQDYNYSFTERNNIIDNVKELFGKDISEELADVNNYYVGEPYAYKQMSCVDKYCYFFAGAGGETGVPQYFYSIISESTLDGNFVYTVKEFYKGYDYDGVFDIYTQKDGELLLKGTTIRDYEELIKVLDSNKLNTYNFTFDKDGKFVSCVKV